MSRLDSRFPELDLYLQGKRRQLNRRLMWGEALAAWLVAAPVALAMALLLPGTREWIPLYTSGGALLGVAAWLAWKWRERLSLAQASSWLDEAQRSKGLFRAAAEALEHEEFRFPDESILHEADRRKNDRPGVRLPWKTLSLRVVYALAVGLGCSAALLFTPATLGGVVDKEPSAPETKTAKPGEEALPKTGAAPKASARDLAKRLFPEDKRLEALAEQALVSGDPRALESLLDQTKGQAAPKPPSGNNRAEPKGGGPGTAPGKDPGAGRSGPPGEQRSGSGSGSSSPQGSLDSTNPGTQGGSAQPSEGPHSQSLGGATGQGPGPGSSGSGKESNSDRQSGNGNKGGGTPGTTHSDAPLGSRAPLAGNDRRLTMPEKGQPGLFEYVLPETGAKVPLSRVLPDSRRSAEAALDRTNPPLEFENAIRQYFLSLSQETKP